MGPQRTIAIDVSARHELTEKGPLKPAPSIVIIGDFKEEHLGCHLREASDRLEIPCQAIETSFAKSQFSFLNKIAWRALKKRSWNQGRFQKHITDSIDKNSSNLLIVTGTAPVNAATLVHLKSNSFKTCMFVTDDPWNKEHAREWVFQSLEKYDLLLTPRRANLKQLETLSGKPVFYLPFAYNPALHFEEKSLSLIDHNKYRSDVMFFGGADRDRLPYIKTLIRAGFNVKLYGGYWDRYPETKGLTLGIVPTATLRKAIKASKVVLNLVRRSNRDGHVMRSYEIPAMGGCMLTEETEEHREIFGQTTVPFFNTPDEMVDQIKLLIDSPTLRTRFSTAAKIKITHGGNTYRDRLHLVLQQLQAL
ncbi:MAG: hypothetical protein EXR74_01515 [Bdellovibrionales bacterium]|nr:hypothetical protein [Bdellovibrionales bacterium]